MSRNLAASIRARLKNHADAAKEDFNLTLTRYGLERLLYRLSVSPHANRFLLKGALLFSLWYDQPHRPTRDADLLAFGPDEVDAMVDAFREICAVPCEDGIVFDPASVRGEEIRKSAGYGGVRIDVPALLDGARIALQVDVGFGDAVTPGPQAVRYPVLLDGLPAPELRAYPKATVVAEKLHAICLLGPANTRMKDYFDLDLLLRDEALDPAELRTAIKATFARRKLALPSDWPVGLGDAFASAPVKQAQWTAFLRKNRLEPVSLPELIGHLRAGLARLGAAESA
jgi:Nucleotidyl transferase AbiEii toxin, Type IV TA system